MKRINILGILLILFITGSIYFATQLYTIYGGDAGDLVSAIVTRGVPHPPGYPLYTALGVLLNEFIHAGTSAWRIGFLSSIPAVFALVFLFDLLFCLTKRFLISLTAVLVLAFSYPFWLYSITVEVFSLNNLFLVLLLWSLVKFAREGRRKFLYLGAFIFGLALAHQQIIIFLLPALFILAWSRKKSLRRSDLLASLPLILAGFIPYIYVFVAASGNPGLNWLEVPTLSNFIGLITRSVYGTFQAGQFIAHEPLLRLLNIWGFFDFALKDFRIAGLILFLLGALELFRKEKHLFIVFAAGLLSYFFFLFYASFPLTENFIVGTFERFILPLYIFLSIFISFGLLYSFYLATKLFGAFLNINKAKKITSLIGLVFLIYPTGLFIINYPKLGILKYDFTAENLGRDILNTASGNGIILNTLDTPLFDSQYIYFTEKKWPEVKLVHFAKLLNKNSQKYFQKFYPDIVLPDYSLTANKQFLSFISSNYPRLPIYSNQAYETEGGTWIPWGLLFRYFRNEDMPVDSVVLAENKKLWSSYHDPLSGSLSIYKNLLLADILRHYSVAHQEYGFWAAKRGYNSEAEKHLLTAEKLTPNELDSYNILSQVYIQEGRCDEAKKQIDFRREKDKEEPSNYLLMSLTYSLCYKDASTAAHYQTLYGEKQKGKETQLKRL